MTTRIHVAEEDGGVTIHVGKPGGATRTTYKRDPVSGEIEESETRPIDADSLAYDVPAQRRGGLVFAKMPGEYSADGPRCVACKLRPAT